MDKQLELHQILFLRSDRMHSVADDEQIQDATSREVTSLAQRRCSNLQGIKAGRGMGNLSGLLSATLFLSSSLEMPSAPSLQSGAVLVTHPFDRGRQAGE